MKKAAPVGALVLALLLTAYALLRTDEEKPIEPTRTPRPGATACFLVGRVLDPGGSPLPGVAVRARALSRGPAFRADGVTDERGEFRVRLFPPRGLWEAVALPPERPPFASDSAVRAIPGETVRVVIREPAASPDPVEPNVGGEVIDSYGRLLCGVPIVAVDGEGAIVANAVTGEAGRFGMRVDAPLPLAVRIESAESGSTVTRLPRLDIVLFEENLGTPRGELVVHLDLTVDVPVEELRILLHDSLGQVDRLVERRLLDGPFRLGHVAHGAYDVQVVAGDYGGAVQGFDFTPENGTVVVPVGRAARLRGDLTRPAKVHLVSRSPTAVPLGSEFREADGIRGIVRGVWAETETTDAFDLRGLTPGAYLLRIFGKRVETVEMELRLAAGEDRDLGLLEVERARGVVDLVVRDGEGALEFGYIVSLYSEKGHAFVKEVGPGAHRTARFDGLSAGAYRYRAERMLRGRGHTRRVGWDRPVVIEKGEEKTVEVDCTWRFE
ncbi:MAG: carboxypeptidase-like regulatory domain-containing protein [Planctomycetota bacterium]|jgi:hypothetical protein